MHIQRIFTALLLLLLVIPAGAQPALPPAPAIGEMAALPAPDGDGTIAAVLLAPADPGAVLLNGGIAVWAAADVPTAGIAADILAERLTAGAARLRSRVSFREPAPLPGISGGVIDPADRLALPDADFNGAVNIVYVAALPDDQAIFVRADATGETVFIARRAFRPADGVQAVSALLRAYYDLVLDTENPQLPAWLAAATFDRRASRAEQLGEWVQAYLRDPGVPLLTDAAAPSDAVRGGRVLLLDYLEERYGTRLIRALLAAHGDGLAALSAALERAAILDPVLGGAPTAENIFADFVLAAAINAPFGDNRYQLTSLSADANRPRIQPVRVTRLDANIDGTLPPYGTGVIQFTAPANGAALTVTFTGDAAADWQVQTFRTGTAITPPRVRPLTEPIALDLGGQETLLIVVTRTGDPTADAAAYTVTLSED